MIRLKRLLVSALICTAVNAVCVLFMEYVIGSAYAEVILSAVICLLWFGYAALLCRQNAADSRES